MSNGPPKGGIPPWGNPTGYSWADYGPSPSMSLGQIVDAILTLTDEQRRGLYALLNVAPVTGTSSSNAGAPQTGVAGPGPTTVQNRNAALTAGIQPDGQHTVDPKTGKVFKITPQRERQTEYLGLEERLRDGIAALKKFSDANGIGSDGSGSESLPENLRKEYNALIKAFTAAKQAVKQYKTAHPEEFRGPPQKGKGKRRSDA